MQMTLLVTGGAGYIGRHVVKAALDKGHIVRASMRDPRRGPDLRAALGVGDQRLEIVGLDLLESAGWAEAVDGVDGVLHTASPVPVSKPSSAESVIRPAEDGTKRVVQCAADAGVARVVVTSSIAAILGAPGKGPGDTYDASDWTDPEKPGVRTYARSKTLAERAARRIASDTPGMHLATVNPGFVFGAPIGGSVSSSLTLIRMLLSGKMPALPRLSFPSVSVHDVAAAHLAALEAPPGARILASGDALWMSEIARIVKQAVPRARVPTWVAPDWAVRWAAMVSPSLRMVAADVGAARFTDPATFEALMGRRLADPREAIAETARALAEQ